MCATILTNPPGRHMEREKAEFVTMLSCTAGWLGSAIAVPMVYALLVTGDFAASCPTVHAGFVEHWNEYTLPRRVFAFFTCIEIIVTRTWCIKEFYLVLQSLAVLAERKARTVAMCYMWGAVSTTLSLDVGVLAWVFLHDRVCDDIASELDERKRHTLEPLCVQTSDVDAVLQTIHILNAVLLCAVAIFVTVLASRSNKA
jgi:hypothetical protein